MANEKRLIDANGSYTLNATDNTGHSLCFGGGIIGVMDIRGHCVCEFFSDDAPTIEATPVVHGRWEAVHDGWGRCSNCHRMDSIHENATHCRFCGAKMDGGVSDG